MSQVFTSGKFAKRMCDRCGEKYKYRDLKKEWTGFLVCKTCWDPKTALEFPTNFPTDPEALRDPRPDNDLEGSGGTVYVGSATTDIGVSFTMPELEAQVGEVTITLS